MLANSFNFSVFTKTNCLLLIVLVCFFAFGSYPQPAFALTAFDIFKSNKWHDKEYDVVSIDNAIYDIFETIKTSELEKIIGPLGIKKGEMMLISKKQFQQLNSSTKTFTEYAGGSSANTLAFLATMGKKTVFIGTVSNDKEGNKFIDSLKKVGIEFAGFKKNSKEPTGQSHVFITEDGKRTMLTLLGSSNNFSPKEIDTTLLEKTKIFFTQAYVIDDGERNNLLKSMFIKTKSNGGINIFALSSPYIVKKRLHSIEKLIPYIDVLIGHSAEFESLYNTEKLDVILEKVSLNNKLNVVTLGEKGAYIVYKNKRVFIPAKEANVIDTTGAGDTFAGGFIYGILNGMSLKESGEVGATAAANVIQKIGARLDKPIVTQLAHQK